MMAGELQYSPAIAQELKGIAWKDINQKFKNDFEKTRTYILRDKTIEERITTEKEVQNIDVQLQSKKYNLLGNKTQPPEGY